MWSDAPKLSFAFKEPETYPVEAIMPNLAPQAGSLRQEFPANPGDSG
jgi:hypothetical protein